MSKNQFTGTATQPQRNRNATANFVNLIRTSTLIDTIWGISAECLTKQNNVEYSYVIVIISVKPILKRTV